MVIGESWGILLVAGVFLQDQSSRQLSKVHLAEVTKGYEIDRKMSFSRCQRNLVVEVIKSYKTKKQINFP